MKKQTFFTILLFCALRIPAQTDFNQVQLLAPKDFIENAGQFDGRKLPNHEHILYTANIDGVEFCFTRSGYTIVQRKKAERTEKENERDGEAAENAVEGDQDLNYRITEQYHEMKFADVSPGLTVIPESIVSNYYTYSKQDNSTDKGIRANAFKRLVYKNIFPLTDVVFEFPKDSAGIKYSIYLHPGADIKKVKFYFPGNNSAQLSNGDLGIQSSFGKIIDHQPTSFTEDRLPVKSSFRIRSNMIGIVLDPIITDKTVIIDPWTVIPPFPGTNNAFDVDYDNAGNVYMYGGVFLGQFKILKYNAAGTLLWSYLTFSSGMPVAGDFVVDKNSGRCYYGEGFSGTIGANVFKINTSGIPIAQFTGNPLFSEIWRMDFNRCTHKLVIGGGGINSTNYQLATMDTNLTTLTPVSYITTTSCCHDVGVQTLDKYGNCYQLTNKKSVSPDGIYENQLVKLSPSALSLPVYHVNSNYAFIEVSTPMYYGGGIPNLSNGYNGLATSNALVYSYDSYVLKKWDGGTGSLLTYKRINYPSSGDSSKAYWGGISADDCGNLFLGDNIFVRQYDTALNLVNSYPMPGVVTDVKFDPSGKLYVCGLGFGLTLNPTGLLACSTLPLSVSNTVTNAICTTLGSAHVTAAGGAAPYTITWNTSPPQYGPDLVNVPPGIYIATIQDGDCMVDNVQDTIIIGSSGYLTDTAVVTSINCITQGSAIINCMGGTPGFTYSWSSGQNTTAVSGLLTGTYTVIVTDAAGCADTQTVNIILPLHPVASVVSSPTTCGLNNGSATGSATGGAPPYVYTWTATSATTAGVNNLSNGYYYLIVTDSLGCNDSAFFSIAESTAPVITLSADDTAGCSPLCVQFNSTSTLPVANYSWNFADGSSSVLSDPSHCFNAGTFPVSLITIDSVGCVDTTYLSSPVTVLAKPNAGFSINPASPIDVNTLIHFIDQSSNAFSWLWNFGDADSSVSIIQNPSFTFDQTGTYVTRLIVSDGPCSDTTYMTTVIDIGFTFYAPNSFTPNGSGLNDTFIPRGIMWKENTYELLIFDRWGNELFKSNDPETGWDGKVKGSDKIAQIDTYVWKVHVTDNRNNERFYIGHVNLVK
ncbi:MAG: PKD domain-containing protein [Bacteroidia bacterium]